MFNFRTHWKYLPRYIWWHMLTSKVHSFYFFTYFTLLSRHFLFFVLIVRTVIISPRCAERKCILKTLYNYQYHTSYNLQSCLYMLIITVIFRFCDSSFYIMEEEHTFLLPFYKLGRIQKSRWMNNIIFWLDNKKQTI